MIDHAQISGDETILDLGTGAGYIAIGFARKLESGHVYGIDKYHLAKDGMFSKIADEMRINFFGNTSANAKRNAELENQQDKVTFLQSDIVKSIPFSQRIFDVIVSSQFLYCISESALPSVLEDIDRVLKPSGIVVFFESMHFFDWNIKTVKDFFHQKHYKTTLVKVKEMQNKCYLIGKKPP
jgi:ubiquinone/menaquinone biosynthesis C-methylase UbiE